MACHHDSHYWNHDLTRNLAQRLSRDSRHSGHATQYIVNEGRMVVDQKTLRHSNAVIYNAPGSTLRLVPSMRAPYSSTSHTTHYVPESPWWTTSSSIRRCHGCYEHREIYYGNYCHKCTSIQRVSPPRERHQLEDYRYRHVPRVPERKRVGWH
ncbi:uncharacterized protein F4807DRAFT_433900 [Annulohypoxylon truncatum]|uniref:uncharacterized protein n=1 Tax=Annulohypoxylon truncatum TaxID=327061 RepID=UPI00200785CB|nr:uncharacterized protein F4807DRAFT_433900 [Annulohypoxylon truncatum]KAI1207597.1 hypothetical protein F4807DRAFT_433900 [Annulohypoxylon truncatum]